LAVKVAQRNLPDKGQIMVDILIIEDNEELGNLLSDFLAKAGFAVFRACSGEEGIAYLQNNPVKLLILDIMLPGIDGFGVCSSVRQRGNVPILIVSAKSGKDDKIKGLSFGADDYIEKPFDIDVLIAKIHAILRRNYEMTRKGELLSDGDLSVDSEAGTAFLKQKPVSMTNKEFVLLTLFLQNKGKVLNKEWLFDTVWGANSFSEPSTLTVHINKLREKIEKDPKNPKRITTVWGVGYKYEAAR
jgi:DNA-binding response OmpR family regulator